MSIACEYVHVRCDDGCSMWVICSVYNMDRYLFGRTVIYSLLFLYTRHTHTPYSTISQTVLFTNAVYSPVRVVWAQVRWMMMARRLAGTPEHCICSSPRIYLLMKTHNDRRWDWYHNIFYQPSVQSRSELQTEQTWIIFCFVPCLCVSLWIK